MYNTLECKAAGYADDTVKYFISKKINCINKYELIFTNYSINITKKYKKISPLNKIKK